AVGTQTAAAKLNFLLAQLSPAERRLYTAITNLQTLFREGIYRDITDNLVNSFAPTVEKITKIIQTPHGISIARRTSQTLAHELNRVFDAFTGDKAIKQFERIAEAGRKNLHPVANIAIGVGRSLANIAEAAGPALTKLLQFIEDLVGQFEKLTGQRRSM